MKVDNCWEMCIRDRPYIFYIVYISYKSFVSYYKKYQTLLYPKKEKEAF